MIVCVVNGIQVYDTCEIATGLRVCAVVCGSDLVPIAAYLHEY